MKNGHSENDTFHTLVKLKFLRVILLWNNKVILLLVLPWNWLKWRENSVPKECCGYFLHPLDDYEASPGRSPWTSKNCCRNLSENSASLFAIIIKKIGIYLQPTWFQMQCSGASFCIFLFSNYQGLSRFYNLLSFSPWLRSNSSQCQVIDLFKSTESLKEKVHSGNNWKTEWF